MIEEKATKREIGDLFVRRSQKHNASFYFAVFYVLYMVFFFYYSKAIGKDNKNYILRNMTVFINLIVALILLFYLLNRKIALCKKEKRSLYLFLSVVLISYLINFSGLEKLLGLIIIVLSLKVFKQSVLTKKEFNFLFLLFLLGVIIVLLNGQFRNTNNPDKFNTNTCGLLVSMVFFISLTFFARNKSVIWILICLICVLFQVLFDSRAAMIGCILFPFFTITLRADKRIFRYKTVAFWLFVLSIMGVAFAYIYAVPLYDWLGNSEIKILGKNLFTGRQTIWKFAFESIRDNFWFGRGSYVNEEKIQEGYYEAIMQMHNQPLGVLASFGFLPFLTFYTIFASFAADKKRFGGNIAVKGLPSIFLITMTIMSYFEVYFFAQYTWLPILITYCLIYNGSLVKRKTYDNRIHTDLQQKKHLK